MGSSRKVSKRPTKRTLVRWDENLNELLLLTVQSVCNANSIKIPWMNVAQTMGHNVTEGAIVQHLAKLRSRRVASNKAVPPPLRRGGVGAVCGSTQETRAAAVQENKRTRNKNQSNPDADESWSARPHADESSDEDWEQGSASRKQKKSPKRKKSESRSVKGVSTKIKHESSDSDAESTIQYSNDLLVPGAKFLEYPNDVGQSQTPSTESPGPKRSKIVVLRVAFVPDAKDVKTISSYTNPYQDPSDTSLYSGTAGFMDMLHSDLPVNYLAAGSSSTGLLSHESGVAPSDLWQAVPTQEIGGTEYAGYHESPDINAGTDGSLDFPSDIYTHLTFESDSYPHMANDYMKLDEMM